MLFVLTGTGKGDGAAADDGGRHWERDGADADDVGRLWKGTALLQKGRALMLMMLAGTGKGNSADADDAGQHGKGGPC